MQLVVGNPVRWIGHDDLCQQVGYDGIISRLTKRRVSIDVPQVGTITVPLNDGRFMPVTDKPIYIPEPVQVTAKPARAPRAPRESNGETKASQMRNKMREVKAADQSQELVITFGMETFGFSRSTAIAYIKKFWDQI